MPTCVVASWRVGGGLTPYILCMFNSLQFFLITGDTAVYVDCMLCCKKFFVIAGLHFLLCMLIFHVIKFQL